MKAYRAFLIFLSLMPVAFLFGPFYGTIAFFVLAFAAWIAAPETAKEKERRLELRALRLAKARGYQIPPPDGQD